MASSSSGLWKEAARGGGMLTCKFPLYSFNALDCCRSLKTVDQLLQSNNLVSKTLYVIIMGVKEGAFRTCLTHTDIQGNKRKINFPINQQKTSVN